jgi:hypothetical protein
VNWVLWEAQDILVFIVEIRIPREFPLGNFRYQLEGIPDGYNLFNPNLFGDGVVVAGELLIHNFGHSTACGG